MKKIGHNFLTFERTPFIFLENHVYFNQEDGGSARIASIEDDEVSKEFFVRLHSYDETKAHELATKLYGKKVRVTIEVIE